MLNKIYFLPISLSIVLTALIIAVLIFFFVIPMQFEENCVSRGGFVHGYLTCYSPDLDDNVLENNFTLTVSNQSFDIDPVDILVKIDGKTVIDDEFLVKQQHNYHHFEFALEPGLHTLYAESTKGKYQLNEEFIIENKLWASIDFVYYEGDKILPQLRLVISETELGFF